MQQRQLFPTRRIRNTPLSARVEAAGAKAYTVYNHMLLPSLFDTWENDYWHLCQHVQVWDVSCERQVEIAGPDAARLVQLMTPRDLSKIKTLQGKYAPICTAQGHILNDPIVIKLADDKWWLSIADSDIKFFAQGLAQGYGLDVQVREPDVFPLAVQGPKAEDLVARVFGDSVRNIRFFYGEMLNFNGVEMYVARSGWSKQGGFEIYVPQADISHALWDVLFDKGQDLNVRAGCPNGNERLEAGLLSFGNDMDEFDTPFECGLDGFLNLDAEIDSLSLPALRAMRAPQSRKLVGLLFNQPLDAKQHGNHVGGFDIQVDGQTLGEIRSHAWSFRYKKHLAFAMLPLSYLEQHSSVTVGEQEGKITGIPFSIEELSKN